jgi:L-ribulose-5-phosphate 3-epimerase
MEPPDRKPPPGSPARSRRSPAVRVGRRRWLECVAAAGASTIVPAGSSPAAPRAAAADDDVRLAGRLQKTLKIGMIKLPGGTLEQRFAAAKAVGFAGVEMQFPGDDVAETRAASAATGLLVDGSVQSDHWQVRHTSPDAATRRAALERLRAAIRDTHAVGGHSVLVVAGKGEDGPEAEIRERSLDNISRAIPLAAETGVQILIENVWNQFLYDHDGGADQTAEAFARFVDDFRSPWVGMQFDIGNHWKFGAIGDWIRTLGHRVRKLDVKGFSRAADRFTAIGAGDIDFADVRRALVEINFHGWVAAEVTGGDEGYLRGVSREMDEAFGLDGLAAGDGKEREVSDKHPEAVVGPSMLAAEPPAR